MKIETIEESAEKWVFETNGHKWSNNNNEAGDNFGSFKEGYKTAQKTLYSDDEVLEVINWYLETFLDDSLGLNGEDAEQKVKHLSGKGLTKEILNYWFEQYKNK